MYYSDGYKYWLAYRKNKTAYYRCSRYKNHCHGRLVMENEKVRDTTEHNHSPEPDRALVERFRKVLTQRAASENLDLYTIYWDEATHRHSEAALLYTFAQAESAMRKARRKQLPAVPTTVQELGDILSVSDLFRIHTGNNRDQFYQTSITLEDASFVVFMHKKTIDLVGRVEEIHIDASFFIQTLSPPTYYIFTAHSVHSERSCPILYAITTSRNQNFFTSIFSYLREQFANFIAPNLIISEFDYTMQQTLNYIFPEANIKGSWFQYAQNIVQQMKYFGLERETMKGHGASALRMIIVLPLLPAEYITPGMEALKKWMQEKLILTDGFKQLCQHIEVNWLRGFGVEKMSIFGLTNGMNNHLQSFNKELKNLINVNNPTVWHILECLTMVATKNYVRLSKKMKSSNVSSTSNNSSSNIGSSGSAQVQAPKKGKFVIDSVIKNATQLWIRTAVHLRHPLQFLQLCSHCIKDINTFVSSDEFAGNSSTSKSCVKVISSIPTGSNTIPTQITYNPQQFNNFAHYSNYAQPSNTITTSCLYQTAAAPAATSSSITDNSITKSSYQTQTEINQQQFHQTASIQPHVVHVQNPNSNSTTIGSCNSFNRLNSTGPPPLAFFAKPKRLIVKRNIALSEPPPLVPIGSGRR